MFFSRQTAIQFAISLTKKFGVVAVVLCASSFLDVRANVAFDASGSGMAENVKSLSWGQMVNAAGLNRLLVVGVTQYNSSDLGASIDSLTWTVSGLPAQSFTRANAAGKGSVDTTIWRLVAPGTGNGMITVTFTHSTYVVGGSLSFTGVDQLFPIDSLGGNACDISTNCSATVSGVPGEMAVEIVGARRNLFGGANNIISARGLDETERWNEGLPSGVGVGAASTIPLTAKSAFSSWTDQKSGLGSWAISIVSIRAATSVPPAKPRRGQRKP